MRMTLVIPSLERGGAERVFSILANAWAEQGNEITIFTLNRGTVSAFPLHSSIKLENLGLPGEPERSVVKKISGHWRRLRVLRRAIRSSSPNIVVSFFERTNILVLIATRGLGLPVIVCERVDPTLYEIGRLWQLSRRLTYRWAAALVCQTRTSLDWFLQSVNVRGYVIPNPVEPAKNNSAQLAVTKKAGHMIVAVGRLEPQKGFDLLLDAYRQVADRHPDWSLTVLGNGGLREELIDRAKKYGLEERVRFAGVVPELSGVLSTSDLFVLSSRFEGFPNALCEAMAAGLPAISFDCPSGPGEIIRQNIDGILVPPEDVPGLAMALDRLMSDPEERSRLSSRAPEIVDRFSRSRVLLLWEQLLKECLATGKDRRLQ